MKVRAFFGEYDVADHFFTFGGAAELFRCSQEGLIYKRYKEPIDDRAAIVQIAKLVHTGRTLLVDQRQLPGSTPEASVNWPVDRVHDGTGRLLGVIIPEIPGRFLTTGRVPRGLDYLILARANPPPARVRVAVLIRIAEIFAWLDAEGLVHGDVSQKNIVWCEAPRPGAYLIDADGLQPRVPPPKSGLVTAGWTDPRVTAGQIPAHDHLSDWYGLSLAMYRGLFLNPGNLDRKADGTWPRPKSFPTELHPRIRYLIERSLSRPLEAQHRPNPGEWVTALIQTYIANDTFDEQRLQVLDNHGEQHRQRHITAAMATMANTTLQPHRPTPRPVSSPKQGPASPSWKGVPAAGTKLVQPAAASPTTSPPPTVAPTTSPPPPVRKPRSGAERLAQRLPLALAGIVAAPAMAFPFSFGLIAILALIAAVTIVEAHSTRQAFRTLLPLQGPADWLLLPFSAVIEVFFFALGILARLLGAVLRLAGALVLAAFVVAVAAGALTLWEARQGMDVRDSWLTAFFSSLPRFAVAVPAFILIHSFLKRFDRQPAGRKNTSIVGKVRATGEGAVTACWLAWAALLVLFGLIIPARPWFPYEGYAAAAADNPVFRPVVILGRHARTWYEEQQQRRAEGPDDERTIAATVTAGVHVREIASTSAVVVGSIAEGQAITVLCQVEGDLVESGHKTTNVWDKVVSPSGYVSHAFVRTDSGESVGPC